MLTPPDFSKTFKVQTDASEIGLGAELTQETGEENVVAYVCRLLRRAEKDLGFRERVLCMGC